MQRELVALQTEAEAPPSDPHPRREEGVAKDLLQKLPDDAPEEVRRYLAKLAETKGWGGC